MVAAAVLTGAENIDIQEFDKPMVSDEAILIKTEIAGVCGTDIHLYSGRIKLNLPIILGHEFAGKIVEIGKDARRLEATGLPIGEGDRITMVPGTNRFCGKCFYCRFIPARPNLCTHRKVYGINMSCKDPPHLFGGYSEFVYIDPVHWYTYKLPEDFPVDFGALIEPMATATRAIERAFTPGMPYAGEGFGLGKNVAIQGAGTIGLLAAATAKAAGAGKVIAIDPIESRLKMAEKMGADHLLDFGRFEEPADRIDEVKRLTNGVGADVVVECTGVPAAVPEGIDMTRNGGKYIEVGHYIDTGSVEIHPQTVCRKDIDILGSWAYPPTQFQTAITVLGNLRDRFPFKELITHRFSIGTAADAFQVKGITKAVIVP